MRACWAGSLACARRCASASRRMAIRGIHSTCRMARRWCRFRAHGQEDRLLSFARALALVDLLDHLGELALRLRIDVLQNPFKDIETVEDGVRVDLTRM